MMFDYNNPEKKPLHKLMLFGGFWLLTFVLYFPAAQAGWVIDGIGFLHNLRHQHFWDFINRAGSADQSFYQLFTLHYYVFYHIWGFNFWLWALLYITTHTANCYLLFLLCSRIFYDSGVKNYVLIPLAGIAIFCISPHISEILICRAYFHYLLSFLFILLALLFVRDYKATQRPVLLWGAYLMFLLCMFTLEIFYLLPLLVFSLALYYRYALNCQKTIFRKTLLYAVLPQVISLAIYFLALFLVFKQLKPHKIEVTTSLTDYLSKLPRYLFHLILLGRFASTEVKKQLYGILNLWPVLVVFYLLLVSGCIFLVRGIGTRGPIKKVSALLVAWSLLFLLFLLPLAFPGPELLIFYDRYTYFAAPFIFILLALLAATWVKHRNLRILLICIYIDCNLYFTIEVNTCWMDSDKINTSLLRNFPPTRSKTVLLLDLPENMKGAPMIGSSPEGMFRAMREVYTDSATRDSIFDVASYNLVADYNGAHVFVLNDSTVNVVLNHVGTWWWYNGRGAVNYENAEYKADFNKVHLGYQLTLRHPASQYLLLYSVGGQWKEVNWALKNTQQD